MCSLPHQDGWNQNHFITPVSTLERDRYRSQPTLPTSNLQMSPVIQSGEPAAKKRSLIDRAEKYSELLVINIVYCGVRW